MDVCRCMNDEMIGWGAAVDSGVRGEEKGLGANGAIIRRRGI